MNVHKIFFEEILKSLEKFIWSWNTKNSVTLHIIQQTSNIQALHVIIKILDFLFTHNVAEWNHEK